MIANLEELFVFQNLLRFFFESHDYFKIEKENFQELCKATTLFTAGFRCRLRQRSLHHYRISAPYKAR